MMVVILLYVGWESAWGVIPKLVGARSDWFEFIAEKLSHADVLAGGNPQDIFLYEENGFPTTTTQLLVASLVCHLIIVVPGVALALLAYEYLISRTEPSHPCCQSCTYNLTGNVSGICPECGTPIPEEQRERVR